MIDARPPSPFRWITTISLLFLVPALLLVGWLAGERVKQTRDFCVSCHRGDGAPLHGAKHDAMVAIPPASLAGVHLRQPAGESIGCYGCHRGVTFGERVATAWLEVKNTIAYIFGDFEEPKKLGRPVGDHVCLPCHDTLREKAIKLGYHYFGAHDRIERVSCAGCHAQHAPMEGGRSFTFERVIKQCAVCHANPETTPFTLRSLRRSEK